MINLDQIAIVLATAISLFGVLAFLRWPYRHYRMDRFRDEIFDIRSQLFCLGADEIGFDHPAYGMFRQMLNGFIRFGDRLGLASFVAISVMQTGSVRERAARSFEESWQGAIDSISPEPRERFLQLSWRMHKAIAIHLLLSVPLILILLIPILLASLIPVITAVVGSRLWRLVAPLFVRVDSAALKVGEEQTA